MSEEMKPMETENEARLEERKLQRAERRKAVLAILGLYLDDLLAVVGVVCLTVGFGLLLGAPAAWLAAGSGLVVGAVTVARARKGGGGR